MNNRWTGGQYSLFRFVFGAYLFGTFLCASWGQVRSAGGVASMIAAIVCVFLMGGVVRPGGGQPRHNLIVLLALQKVSDGAGRRCL